MIADAAWNQLSAAYQTTISATGGPPNGISITAKPSIQCADQAKDFYSRFPGRPQAAQARKMEILLLANAIYSGDTTSLSRITAASQAFSSDVTIPGAYRAEAEAAFEFSQANTQGKSANDAAAALEAVARSLIRDYPDQAPGYLSLLTQALQRDNATARTMAAEVVNSPAPENVQADARRLMNRLDLVGQRIDKVLGPALNQDAKAGWQEGKPTLIYFWASWSPDSLALGQMLAGRKLSAVNLVGICLDKNAASAAAVAATLQLPGQLIYVHGGMDDPLVVHLGAAGTPLVYLTDAQDMCGPLKTFLRNCPLWDCNWRPIT